MKNISVNSTIFELVNKHPEIKDLMVSLGFTDITNPLMLKTAGRVMTIKAGAQLKKINMEKIKERFLENNFYLEDINNE